MAARLHACMATPAGMHRAAAAPRRRRVLDHGRMKRRAAEGAAPPAPRAERDRVPAPRLRSAPSSRRRWGCCVASAGARACAVGSCAQLLPHTRSARSHTPGFAGAARGAGHGASADAHLLSIFWPSVLFVAIARNTGTRREVTAPRVDVNGVRNARLAIMVAGTRASAMYHTVYTVRLTHNIPGSGRQRAPWSCQVQRTAARQRALPALNAGNPSPMAGAHACCAQGVARRIAVLCAGYMCSRLLQLAHLASPRTAR